MLGVRLNPTMTPSDVHLKATAEKMGVGDSFHMAPVGVFFGDGDDADGRPKVRPGTRSPTRTSAVRAPPARPARSAASA